MTRTLALLVAVPLGDGENAETVAKLMTERLDGTEHVGNLRLAEASYAVTSMGARATLIDGISFLNRGLGSKPDGPPENPSNQSP